MKKILFFATLLLVSASMFSNNWMSIYSSQPAPASIELISSNVDRTIIKVSIDGFYTNEVMTPRGMAYTISVDNSTAILFGGAPDLPKVTTSMIIPDVAGMDVKVISSKFTEYNDMEIAPSKGNFTRDIDPATVPYTYGSAYQKDTFFPGDLASLRDPYIIRDYRGQTVLINPFQYNPVTKVLRVYDEITVEVYKVNNNGINPLNRTKSLNSVVQEFNRIYENQFINADATKYDPVEEHGNMLIISHADFISAIQPFVDWKTRVGVPVEVVDVATIGGTAAIKRVIIIIMT